MKLWPKVTGADYLIARTDRDEKRAEAEALSEALGGLPLAHEQAAAYCERLSVSFADYARRLAATPITLLDAEEDAPLEYHDKLTVAKTFSLAIDEAAKLHPAAEPLVFYAALLAPEPIPLFLFSEAREEFGEPLASLADDGLDEAVAALRAFALVDRETFADERDPTITTETIRLHRLVRASRWPAGPPTWPKRTGRFLSRRWRRSIRARVFDEPNAWPRARRLDALALDLVAGSRPAADGRGNSDWPSPRPARFLQAGSARGLSAARPLFERALAIREKSLGPEDPLTPARVSTTSAACFRTRATSPARGRS